MYSSKYSPIYFESQKQRFSRWTDTLAMLQTGEENTKSKHRPHSQNQWTCHNPNAPVRRENLLLDFFVEIFSDNKLRLKLLLEYYSTLWCMWLICSWSVCRYYKPNLSFPRVCSSEAMPLGIIIMHRSDVANPDRQHIHVRRYARKFWQEKRRDYSSINIIMPPLIAVHYCAASSTWVCLNWSNAHFINTNCQIDITHL